MRPTLVEQHGKRHDYRATDDLEGNSPREFHVQIVIHPHARSVSFVPDVWGGENLQPRFLDKQLVSDHNEVVHKRPEQWLEEVGPEKKQGVFKLFLGYAPGV
jgi:hypothetical protein